MTAADPKLSTQLKADMEMSAGMWVKQLKLAASL